MTARFLLIGPRTRRRKGDGFIFGFLGWGMVEAIPAVSGFLIPNTIAADVSSHLEIP